MFLAYALRELDTRQEFPRVNRDGLSLRNASPIVRSEQQFARFVLERLGA